VADELWDLRTDWYSPKSKRIFVEKASLEHTRSVRFCYWIPTPYRMDLRIFTVLQLMEMYHSRLKHLSSRAAFPACSSTGHDPEQIHELLRQMFSPSWHFTMPLKDSGKWLEVAIPTSTTRLDTLEFTEYVEKCRMWANEFLGLNIPLPGEVAA
jgi:hypothetical protein